MHVPDAYTCWTCTYIGLDTSGEQGRSGLAEIWNRFLGTKWKRARSPHSIRMYQVPRFLSVLPVHIFIGFLMLLFIQTKSDPSRLLYLLMYNLLLLAIDFIYSGG